MFSSIIFALLTTLTHAESAKVVVIMPEGASAMRVTPEVRTASGTSCALNVSHLSQLGMEVMSTGVAGCTPQRLCEELLARGDVEDCEEGVAFTPYHTPNDRSFNDQWGLHMIEAQAAWNYHRGDASRVIVAVHDSGVKLDHPDLQANLWRNPGEIPNNGIDDDFNGWTDDVHGIDAHGWDGHPNDDSNGHGTHCAGIIGAVGNNGIGISGVAQGPQIMALRFAFESNTAIQVLDYALYMGAKISSLSWGGYGFSRGYARSIERAQRLGHLFVISAGNDANDNDVRPSYPCAQPYENVICVAASWQDDSGGLAYFSNYGKNTVDVAAPGHHILSTFIGPEYAHQSGTSMAAPFVAGLAALLWDYKPELTWRDVKNAIVNTADVSSFGGKVGCGRINARKAMEAVASGRIPTTCGGVPVPVPTPSPTSASDPAPTPAPRPRPPAPSPNPGFDSYAGWGTVSRYNTQVSPCDVDTFVVGLAAGQGYYSDPAHPGGWCRSIEAHQVAAVRAEYGTSAWTPHNAGVTYLPKEGLMPCENAYDSIKAGSCDIWENQYNYCTLGPYVEWMHANCAKSCKSCGGNGPVPGPSPTPTPTNAPTPPPTPAACEPSVEHYQPHPSCVASFAYKGQCYRGCTAVNYNRPWCSLEADFKYFWRYRECIASRAQDYSFLAGSSFPESPEDLAPKVLVANFSNYPNSKQEIDVSGSVSIIQGALPTPSQILKWSLTGLDPACQRGSGKQCGIQIHANEFCHHDASMGDNVLGDPLIALQYNASTDGVSEVVSGVEVSVNLSIREILGKTVIVYDSVGLEIACALIPFGPGRDRPDDVLLSGVITHAKLSFVALVLCAWQTFY